MVRYYFIGNSAAIVDEKQRANASINGRRFFREMASLEYLHESAREK